MSHHWISRIFVALAIATSVQCGPGVFPKPDANPVIPSLVVRCISEIEERGTSLPDLYQKYKDSCDANLVECVLKEFAEKKKVLNLSCVDPRTICVILKEYLSDFPNQLIPEFKISVFRNAVIEQDLQKAVANLPRINRDTLCLLILHLKKVLSNEECETTPQAMATIFAPVVTGFGQNYNVQIGILKGLLDLDAEFYRNILEPMRNMKSTASTETLFKKTSNLYTKLAKFAAKCSRKSKLWTQNCDIPEESVSGCFRKLEIKDLMTEQVTDL